MPSKPTQTQSSRDPASSSVMSTWVRAVLDALGQQGIDAHALQLEARIDDAHLHDPDGRVPLSQTTRMWQLADDAVNDPCLGLRVAKGALASSFQALSLGLMPSSNLRELLDKLVCYSPPLADHCALRLELTAHAVKIYLDVASGPDAPPLTAVDAMLCLVSIACRQLHGSSLRALQVRLRRPEPSAHVDDFLKAFHGAPVVFQAPDNVIVFDREAAEASQAAANLRPPHAQAERRSRPSAKNRGTDEGKMMVARVKALLIEHMPEGEPSHVHVAQALQLSVRSLQRHLADAGTSYRLLLQHTRLQQAQTLLADERISISEIAFLLGFRDASTFTHAFRRWTGSAPSDWRRQRA